ncbi:MAG: hypothetical protein PVH19_10790 [Planctomycetia bacterium]|jgi:hypothetical protein
MGKEKFSCPHCGLLYNFRPDWAGQKAKCKCCKNVFTVPDQPTTIQRDSKATSSSSKKEAPPEAKIVVDDTPIAPQAPPTPPEAKLLPQAPLVMDAESAILDPIDEPAAAPTPTSPTGPPPALIQDTYQIESPSNAGADSIPFNDPLANYAPPGASQSDPFAAASGPALQSPKPKKMKKRSAGGGSGVSITKYLLSRPLACILFLLNTGLVLAILLSGNPLLSFNVNTTITICVNYFIIYVGIRSDRGEAINPVLIKAAMGICLLYALYLLGSGLVAMSNVGDYVHPNAKDRDNVIAALRIATIIGTIVALVVYGVIVGIYYLLMRFFGFYRTSAVLSCIGLSLTLLLSMALSGVADKIQEQENDQEVAKNEHKNKYFKGGPSKEDMEKEAKRLQEQFSSQNNHDPFGKEEPNPSGHNPFESTTNDPSSSNSKPKNPFEEANPDPSSSKPKNPFEATTPETSNTPSENPFRTGDTPNPSTNTPANDNPFYTPGSNHLQYPTTNTPTTNPYNTPNNTPTTQPPVPDPAPSEPAPAASGVGSVSIDELLDKLNQGSPTHTKRLLKAISHHTPDDKKREAVCRAMLKLLKNKRYAFAEKETIETLSQWWTSKVSEDVAKIVKQSTDFDDIEKVKRLATIPDDKVAKAVVELWTTTNTFFLNDAIPPLDERAEEPLWNVLNSSDAQLRAKACEFLGRQGTSKSLSKLRKLVNDKDRSVSLAAKKAIEKLSQ